MVDISPIYAFNIWIFSSLLLQSVIVTRKQYQFSLLQVDLTDFLDRWMTYSFLVLVLIEFPG